MTAKSSPHKVQDPSEFELDAAGRVNRRLITNEVWNRIKDHYLLNPGDHGGAGRAGNVGYNTARKAWEEGYSRRPDRPPIKELAARANADLRGELADLRRITQKDRALRQKKAETDVNDDKALEARLLRTARGNALASMAVSHNLLKMAIGLTHRLSNMLDDPTVVFTPKQIVSLVSQIVRMNHAATESAGITTRMQKDMLGGPEVLVQVGGMSYEDSVKTIEGSQRTLRRLRERVVDTTSTTGSKAVDMLDAMITAPPETKEVEEAPPPLLMHPPATAQQLHLPTSKNIRQALYEASTGTLWVTFVGKGGQDRTYRYTDVPTDTAADWETALSAGKYFKAAIKNSYAYVRLEA